MVLISNYLNERKKTMISTIKRFLADETGATAIEYGLIAALVAVAAVAGMSEVGTSLAGMFDTVATVMNAALPTP